MLKSKRSAKRNERIDGITRNLKKNKRSYLTRSSTKNKTICNEAETTELLISGPLEISEEFASKFSKSVVSLALYNGHKVLFTCSGIAVLREGYVTRFLTSASLVKALNDKRKDHDNLKIEVRHGDNVAIGFLGEYDLDRKIAAVNVESFPDIQTIGFKIRKEFPPHIINVVAVGCDISGKLITTSGILNCHLSESLPSLMTTTCKISKVSEGGPLFDFDGNFLGMNVSFSTEETSFVPEARLLVKLMNFSFLKDIKFPKEVRAVESSNGEMPYFYQEVHRYVLNDDQFRDLESLGYPEPPKSLLNDGIILANNYEEPFGDICDRGVWKELNETVASNIQENIVALASFNGKKRFFACTGCLIEWNGCTTILTAASLIRDSYISDKIVENLRIDVLLPNKKVAKGILQHYNLHYNIALVSVNGFCASQPVKIPPQGWFDGREILAVGCIFKSEKLMAAKGDPIPMVVTHDCKFLFYTTCGITKAGIGGPLLDFDGKFLGINLYDKYGGGTPFLSWNEILDVLDYFKTKRTVADAGHDGYASHVIDWTIAGDRSVWCNRWPVPLPFWCRPDVLEGYNHKMQIRRPLSILCANGETTLQA